MVSPWNQIGGKDLGIRLPKEAQINSGQSLGEMEMPSLSKNKSVKGRKKFEIVDYFAEYILFLF